jgi:hypothetical protein
MNTNAIRKKAEKYAKAVFKEDFLDILYLGEDKDIEGYNIYEFKIFLTERREFYLNIISIEKAGKKRVSL